MNVEHQHEDLVGDKSALIRKMMMMFNLYRNQKQNYTSQQTIKKEYKQQIDSISIGLGCEISSVALTVKICIHFEGTISLKNIDFQETSV